MSSWVLIWSQLRLRGLLKIRTHRFVHRLYDNTAVSRWLRFHRRQQYARAVASVRAALDTPRRRLLMLSATGIYNSRGEENAGPDQNVKDQEMQDLANELERTKQLLQETLFCPRCTLRLIIETRHPGVKYCMCDNGKIIPLDGYDGWTPYMETKDVIIWRKEYKSGTKLYMYKVYGRYDDVSAANFTSVQLDVAYRRVWDNAVASLFTIEKQHDRRVIHWEVMWPRMFANRDYVYERRHKEFSVQRNKTEQTGANTDRRKTDVNMRDNSTANETATDRLFVIVSKSVEHPKCPVNKNAIRVTEYWSHMVIRSLNGPEEPGMEFVLTYYDQPAVGGMPGGVAAWATGRAAPHYLASMRSAALNYSTRAQTQEEDIFKEAVADREQTSEDSVREEDMESSKRGPIIDEDETKSSNSDQNKPFAVQEKDSTKAQEQGSNAEEYQEQGGDEEDLGEWWRYMFPFYYFD